MQFLKLEYIYYNISRVEPRLSKLNGIAPTSDTEVWILEIVKKHFIILKQRFPTFLYPHTTI
jgi:hypothetical protein